MPKRFEVGSAPPEFPNEPEDYYRHIYFEGLDLIVQAISDQFDQLGYHTYRHLQKLIFKAIRREDYKPELELVCNLYGSDLNTLNLEMQLNMLGNTISDSTMDIFDVKKYFMDATAAVRSHFNEVMLVLKLILVLPATNTTSKRSFSAMKYIKSYLRSTMGQERLNNLMVLHVYKELTDEIELKKIANDFISKCPWRQEEVFGKF